MDEFSVVDVDFQAEAPDQTTDQRGIKRPLSEVQRKAKIERDRARRQEHRVQSYRNICIYIYTLSNFHFL